MYNSIVVEVKMCENKKVIISLTTVFSAVIIAAAAALFLYEQDDRKKIGGKQIKVNYKFSKEFDD